MTEKISRETVKKIAELSRLYVTDAEITKYQKELEGILDLFNFLDFEVPQVDEPCPEVNDHRLACDVPSTDLLEQGRFSAQLPKREGNFVRVPAILSDEH
jgi:aspartyl/glutamyl-tRNA(Asn/Gln) amidotransferase C subunit